MWACPLIAHLELNEIFYTCPVDDTSAEPSDGQQPTSGEDGKKLPIDDPSPQTPDQDARLPHDDWERLYGTTRYATAAAVSAGTFTHAQNVIIASGENYPDALSAASLAGALSAPILVVPSTGGLPAAVSAEITRLGATHAVIVGGNLVVSNAAESQLKNLVGASNVERVFGTNRVDTCLKVTQRLGSAHSGTAIVVNGFKFSDALSASAAGKKKGLLLLCGDSTAGRNPATVLSNHAGQVTQGRVAGGTLAVPTSVLRDYMLAAAS